MRSDVSGVRNSCATVATRSVLSSSKCRRRVTSCSVTATPVMPPARVVERAAAGQELALRAGGGEAHDLLVPLGHVGAASGQHVGTRALDGGPWRRIDVAQARGLLVPGKAKDGPRRLVGGQDAPAGVEDHHRIGKALDGGVGRLPGLDDRAQGALLELGQALGHGVEVRGQGRDLVRALDPSPRREVLLSDAAHGVGQHVEGPKGARDGAARRDHGQGEGDHGRGQGGHLEAARHRLRVLALPHHRRLVHVEHAVGRLLEGEETRLQLAEVDLRRLRRRIGREGGDACLVVFPAPAQLGRRFLLPGLGDVVFLDPQLGFEGGAVVGDLRRPPSPRDRPR